ncbi:E3 ubiquitin-protein ligase Topors-like [Scleropages formosus]|uniref:E3 ubiquitin-protein ligase Topors n=1 Tax=Scleropages formosus TaxID=113540 RepID=A0A0N8K0C4_SCLFO|nr:E3 ubiquitin-protein ligase Topors-like [Scleropages formosus]
MAPTKMKLRVRKKDGPSKASQSVSAEASPDSKCPICLDRFNNMAYLDRCLHKFCFRCIHEWSKNKAECPLCKQPFNSIFHSIKAENDFKEFVLRPTENGSFASPDGRRFRYRTTQTRERRQTQRRTSPPQDNGVLFEGLAASSALQPDSGFHRMMTMMAARRRAQNEGRTVRHLREQEMVSFRRALYRSGVRVRSVRDGGRYRDISAAFFQRNPACLHRLLPWLRRELTVLYGAHGSLVNIVQHIIMSRITRYDMEDQAIHDELRPFLLTRTDHFLHEFISFARSPFNMEAYDQHAIYDCPAPSYEEGSTSDSSVIAISEDEAGSVELSQQAVAVPTSVLSQAPWDDETPGPSYSTTEQVHSLLPPVSESESGSSREEVEVEEPRSSAQQGAHVKSDPAVNDSGDVSSDEEDCVIVGYVKPMAERTPELVQLSSDSEESDHNEGTEAAQKPQHIHFPSLSPPSSICSSASRHKSPQSTGRSEQQERNWASPENKRRHSPSHRGKDEASGVRESSNSKHQSSSQEGRQCRSRERSRSRSKDRSNQSHSRRSRSTDWSWSARSPTISLNSDSTLSRDRRCSRSRSRDCLPSKDGSWRKKRDRDYSQYKRSREKSLYSYSWDSYSHYSREKERTDALYVQSRSYSSSFHVSPDYGSRSHRRSRPRESHRRERRRSRSHSRTRSRNQSRNRSSGSRSHSRIHSRSRSRSHSSSSSRSAHRRARHEKPGGKRKYKTRHLEDTGRDHISKQHVSSSSLKEKRGSSERHHNRSRKNKSRSPSVEIIYEGRATGESRKRHRKKKKHKKKCRKNRSSDRAVQKSPVVITIDSDTDHSPAVVHEVIPSVIPVSNENGVPPTANHPSDTSLLESILQDLEQHLMPIDPSSVDVSNPETVSAEVTFGDIRDALQSERKQSSLPAGAGTSTTIAMVTSEHSSSEQTVSMTSPDNSMAS